jgi:hypothetical protein
MNEIVNHHPTYILFGLYLAVCILIGIGIIGFLGLVDEGRPTSKTAGGDFRVADLRNDSNFRHSMSIRVDGEVYSRSSGIANSRAEWYKWDYRADGRVVEHFNNWSDEGYYQRTMYNVSSDAVEESDDIQENPNRTLYANKKSNGTTILVSYNNHRNPINLYEHAQNNLVIYHLGKASYKVIGNRSKQGRLVLKPLPGFYGEKHPYRLSNTTGKIVVDSTSKILYTGNVSWNYTPASRTKDGFDLEQNETWTATLHYEYEPMNRSVERPAWVDSLTLERNQTAP